MEFHLDKLSKFVVIDYRFGQECTHYTHSIVHVVFIFENPKNTIRVVSQLPLIIELSNGNPLIKPHIFVLNKLKRNSPSQSYSGALSGGRKIV
jgi:hypothetical protein